jgi:chaperone modulatory protein CbpM
MKVELTEVLWLDAQQELSLADLAALSGLSEAELRDLVDYGVIAPVDSRAEPPVFRGDCVVIARTACRLRTDFELDAPGLALALTLLGRIRDLEARLRELSAQSPHWPRKNRDQG